MSMWLSKILTKIWSKT